MAYNKPLKITLTALATLYSGYLFSQGSWGLAILMLLLAGFFILLIYKNESIMAAFFYLRKGDNNKADRFLATIKYPEKLVKSQHGYFYFLKGLIESQKGSLSGSERNFKKALSSGLRMKQDQAVAKLNLAGICVSKRNKREATHLLQEVKKLDTNKILSDQIKMVESQLKRI